MAVSYAANALVTREECVRAGASGSDQDFLTELINAASQLIEDYLERPLARKVIGSSAPEIKEGSGGQELPMDLWPIESVQAVRVDSDDVLSEVKLYGDLAAEGLLWRQNGWPRAVGSYSDLTGHSNPHDVERNVEVEYTAGYWLPNFTGSKPSTAIDLPWSIRRAAVQLVLWLQRSGAATGIVEESTPGGYRVRYQDVKPDDLPAHVTGLLGQYRRRIA